MSFLVYVDDLIGTGNNELVVDQFIQALTAKFSVKNLGSLHYFIGVEVVATTDELFLSQHKYVTDLLTNTNMHNSKDVQTPMSITGSLTLHDGSPLLDTT